LQPKVKPLIEEQPKEALPVELVPVENEVELPMEEQPAEALPVEVAPLECSGRAAPGAGVSWLQAIMVVLAMLGMMRLWGSNGLCGL
jgi:hypothetical protein